MIRRSKSFQSLISRLSRTSYRNIFNQIVNVSLFAHDLFLNFCDIHVKQSKEYVWTIKE